MAQTFVGAGTPFQGGTVHDIYPNLLSGRDFNERWRTNTQAELQTLLSQEPLILSVVLRQARGGPVIIELDTCSPEKRAEIIADVLDKLKMMGLHDDTQGVDDHSAENIPTPRSTQ